MKKPIFTFLIFSLVLLGNCLIYAEVVDKIVAIVNNDVITQSELDQVLAPIIQQYEANYGGEDLLNKIEEAKKQILNRLIEDKLILQEANKQKIEVDEREIDDRIKEVRSRFSSEAEFENALNEQNLTLKSLFDKYRDQIIEWRLVNKEVTPKINIAPSEIAAYYNSHLKDFTIKESVKVRHILIRYKPEKRPRDIAAKAKKVYALLKKGADFAKIAKKYSDTQDAAAGGDMGYVPKGDMMKEIDDAIFKLDVGQISDLIKTDLGYHIFKVEEKKPEDIAPLSGVQAKIKNILSKDKFEGAYQNWIEKLKKNAYIQIR